jgi:hypothetical protein
MRTFQDLLDLTKAPDVLLDMTKASDVLQWLSPGPTSSSNVQTSFDGLLQGFIVKVSNASAVG